jgi:membrane peptidoglycan carboxypeptidase
MLTCKRTMLGFLNKASAFCLTWVARTFMHDQTAYLRERLEVALNNNRKCLYDQISDYLVATLVAGEDKRFWSHGGIDLAAICRALYHILVRRRLQGASTIEQQLVRTLTGHRRFSVKRKVREMALACVIGNLISKREIAVLYLCCAYYGWRMNSLAEACSRVGLSVAALSHEQAAELVARLKYPEPRFASAERRALITNRASYILQKTASRNSL